MVTLNQPWLHIISEKPPGSRNGHGITLSSIVSCQPDVHVGLVCHPDADLSLSAFSSAPRLSPSIPQLPNKRFLRQINSRIQFNLKFAISSRISRFIKSRQPSVILLSPTGSGQLFFAGESVVKALNLPTILWILDDWLGGAGKELTWITPKMYTALRRCAARSIARFAISKEMAERYEEELGGKWEVLCNGVEPRDFQDHTEPSSIERSSSKSFKIGFFGAVYSVQIEPLEALCEACCKLGMEVIIYGDVDPNLKPRLGRFNCMTQREAVPEDVARAEMKMCDALYLPYSFNPSVSRVVETSFPTKLADYIVSGKPVIINGPPTSTIIKFSHRTGWGIPVESMNVDALEVVLSRLWYEYGNYVCKFNDTAERAADEIDLPHMRSRFRKALLVGLDQQCEMHRLSGSTAQFDSSISSHTR